MPVENFAYLCTRVKVKSLELYAEHEIRRMLDMDLRAILRFLHERVYKEEVEEGSIKYRFSTSDVIEYALTKNLGKAYEQIYSYALGSAKARLEMILGSIDVQNIKTFLRAVHSKAPKEEMMKNILPGGKYPESFWEKGLSAESLENYFAKTEFGKVVKEYLAERNLAKIEDRIDKEYYARLLNFVKGMQESRADCVFLEFVRKEIDLRNLATAMKIRFYSGSFKIPLSDVFIPGGWSINPKGFRSLCEAKDDEEFLSLASAYWFGREIVSIMGRCAHCSGQIKRLEHYLARIAKNFALIYPISILPVLSYLLAKRIEVEQIRIISRGKAHGLAKEEILGMLGW